MNQLIFLFLTTLSLAQDATKIDALIAKVGREAVLQSDLERFKEVNGILICAGILKQESAAPDGRKELLDSYIEEELMYLEARSRKISTAGMIPQAVRSIHKDEDCKARWQRLGQAYSKFFRTEARAREGESLLVRELEKRVLVDKFRKSELISDGELWKREVKSRHPVKVYLE